MRKWEYIVIHHSLTTDGKEVSWNAIRSWHKGITPGSPYKWLDIGYHFGIEKIGSVYEVLLGRSLLLDGAHCIERKMNKKGIGICLVGNFDINIVPTLQYNKLMELIRVLRDIYSIPKENVLGHRELAPYKSCPGKMLDISVLRGIV